MDSPADIIVCGAERQAAVSAALSRPDLHFSFLSDQAIVDGWDLPNVSIRLGKLDQLADSARAAALPCLVLCSRWLPFLEAGRPDYSLDQLLPRLATAFPDVVTPVYFSPPSDRPWILKGNRRHRPDEPVTSFNYSAVTIADPHECGSVYQPVIESRATALVMGYRDAHNCRLGIVALYQEAFAREDFLMAGESIRDPMIESVSEALVDHIEHHGYFSINWVVGRNRRSHVTSIRPVPRALFQLFRAGGIDLLSEHDKPAVLRPGLKLVVDHHYASYGP